MKEIKFRVYDYKNKKTFDVYKLNFETQEVFFSEDVDLPFPTVYRRKLADVKLMQYTGLKDINGNDIYEGDIIDIHQTVNGQNLFIITFQDLKVMPTYLWGDNYEYDILELLDYYSHPDEVTIEVVGNVYENPDLVETRRTL